MRVPNKGDLTEVLRYAEMNFSGGRNHVFAGMVANVKTAFGFGEDLNWREDLILDYKLHEQKLRLFVDGKIRQVDEKSTDFVWVSDGAPYDWKKLIN